METADGHTQHPGSGRSYRTYEEWKPVMVRMEMQDESGSYRTYEEWKRDVYHCEIRC